MSFDLCPYVFVGICAFIFFPWYVSTSSRQQHLSVRARRYRQLFDYVSEDLCHQRTGMTQSSDCDSWQRLDNLEHWGQKKLNCFSLIFSTCWSSLVCSLIVNWKNGWYVSKRYQWRHVFLLTHIHYHNLNRNRMRMTHRLHVWCNPYDKCSVKERIVDYEKVHDSSRVMNDNTFDSRDV